MPARLVALDEGPDITLDRAMVVVGRHPSCDTRLDSLRVSRQHCCMSQDNGEVTVRDLGSTNGIRINGQRVERGRLRPGDELSIAHIRYRLENGQGHEQTIADGGGLSAARSEGSGEKDERAPAVTGRPAQPGPHAPDLDESDVAAALRRLLPNGVGDQYQIKVIVQRAGDHEPDAGDVGPAPSPPKHGLEKAAECHSESSL
jgi:hypothetical protein